jgi:probable blue pigment (indigoidine) exporter
MEAKWRWVLITAIAPVAWGSNYFVTRQFLPAGDPLWGAAIRALPAGIILLLIARRRPHASWWWKSLVLGTLNVGAFFVLVYLASQLLPSSIASTIMATSAGVLMLLAWPLLAERPTIFGIAGAALGFGGVCVLLVEGGVAVAPWGVAASLAAMLMSSVGFVLTKRWAPTESTIAVTSWQLIAGGVLILPFALAVEGAPPALDATEIAGFAYVTVIATALAFVAWFTGLRHLPAGTVGLVGLLNPVTGVLLGTLLGAEPFGPRQAAGTALVLLGVLIGQRRSAARRPSPPADQTLSRTRLGSRRSRSVSTAAIAIPISSTTTQLRTESPNPISDTSRNG